MDNDGLRFERTDKYPTPEEYRFVSDEEKGDEINPSYYKQSKYPVEVIEIAEQLDFLLGNVIKYILRAGLKTEYPLTDLKKAMWYLSRKIENLEGKDGREVKDVNME